MLDLHDTESPTAARPARGRTPGWVVAGWLGIAAGVFDAGAFFLHPVSVYVLPFAILVYALVSILLFFLVAGLGRLLGRLNQHPSFALGCLAGFWITFFGAYAVTTSTSRFLATRTGLVAGVLVALLCGLLGFWLTRRLHDRIGRSGPGASGRNRQTLQKLPLLLLVAGILIYPTFFLVSLRSRASQGPVAAQPPPRGFVLVSLDAARGDRLSGLGYPRPTTPEVDRLIRGGVAFSRAYIQEPASGPGHACMLTGLPPLAHGLVANAHTLGDSVLTVAERLQEAGFSTAAFMNNFYLESRFGFDQGFDCFINQYRASRLDGWAPSLLLRGLSLFHFWHRLVNRPGKSTDDTINLTLDWLRHRSPGDFFVFLHIMDPHSPYEPPADLRDRFYVPEGPPVRDTEALRRRIEDLSAREVAALRDLYDGDIALADRKVGRLVAELQRQGLLASTLIVVTADHGEVMYEKEKLFDHGSMWNGNLHVPLVFHYPDRLPGGTVRDQPVPAGAVVPTALTLLDIPYREQTATVFHPPLLGPEGEVRPVGSPFVFTLGIVSQGEGAVTSERFKLIVREGRSAGFYDLRSDPTEQTDLWPEVQAEGPASETFALADSMLGAFLHWQQMSREESVGLSRQTAAEVDRETARRLRALGY